MSSGSRGEYERKARKLALLSYTLGGAALVGIVE